MGPLVPDLIGNELNYIVAIFVGIAFGFIMEQAGFSSSKKLVGLFYGYDFTVLRVFFTAGVTALFGVAALSHFGLLNTGQILINPTFLWSAIVGGIIMGLGFVLGGFCPGTSVCAAAIGKVDAMIFIAGSFLGVLVFAEGYPLFEGLYKASNWGNVRIFNTLGVSQSLFVFLIILIAVSSFYVITLIEQKVNGFPNPEFKGKKIYNIFAAVSVLLAFSAFLLPDRNESLLQKVNDTNFISSYQVQFITPDELAFRIMDHDKNLQIFDLREKKEFDSLSLPGSTKIKIESLFDAETGKSLSYNHKKNIFIASDELTAKKGAVIANELGYNEIFVLQGGFEGFNNDILNFKKPEQTAGRKEIDTFRFREKARIALPELIKEFKLKQSTTEKKGSTRKLVGC